jgi:phage anti-repressor protein
MRWKFLTSMVKNSIFSLTKTQICCMIYHMKHRINFAIEQELIDAAREYAKRQYTSMTDLVRQYFLSLKRELERNEQLDSSKANPIKTE